MSKCMNMRKYSTLLLSAAALSAFSLVLSSCKDDEPPAKPKLSFASTTLTAKESDENLLIEIVLDKAASQEITIDFTLDGSAAEKVAAGTSSPYDYEVVSDYGEVTIAKGETTGTIEIDLLSDFDLEDDETIEIAIDKVSFEDIEITRDDEVTITVQQEDGLIAALEWGVGDGEDYKTVDMDLFLWAENTSAQLTLLPQFVGLSGSTITNLRASYSSPEFFFLPTALLDDGSYGVSATYYEGTQDPMNFQLTYVPVVNGANGTIVTKKASYKLANINAWDADGAPLPLLAATFKKSGTGFTDFSEITVPPTSSRVGTGEKFEFAKRQKGAVVSEKLKKLLEH